MLKADPVALTHVLDTRCECSIQVTDDSVMVVPFEFASIAPNHMG